jgi:hypothetical protein
MKTIADAAIPVHQQHVSTGCPISGWFYRFIAVIIDKLYSINCMTALTGVENIADHWSQKIFYAGRKKKGKEEQGGKKEKKEKMGKKEKERKKERKRIERKRE